MFLRYLLAFFIASLGSMSLSAVYVVSGTINTGEAVKIEFCNKEGWCKLSYTNFYIKQKFLLKLEEEGVYIVDSKADELVYTYELADDNGETPKLSNAGKQIVNQIKTEKKHLPKVRRETAKERQERENISKLAGILKFSTLVKISKCDKFGWCQLEKTGYFVRRDNLKALDVENIYMVDADDTRMYRKIPRDVNSYNSLGDLKIVRLYKVENEAAKSKLRRKIQKSYWFGFDVGYGISSISLSSSGSSPGQNADQRELTPDAKAMRGGTKYAFDAGYTINKKYAVASSFESMSMGSLGTLNSFAITAYYRQKINKKLSGSIGALMGASFLTWKTGLANTLKSGTSASGFHYGLDAQLSYSINYEFEAYGSFKLYLDKRVTIDPLSGSSFTLTPPAVVSFGIRYFF